MPNNAPSSYLRMTSFNFLLNVCRLFKNDDNSRLVYFHNFYMKNGWLYQTCISLLKKSYGIFNIIMFVHIVSLGQLANS